MRIVVAMSGGVDSSVAARLLAREGHDVVGLSMQLYDRTEGDLRFGSCCTIDDLHDARRVAERIGIPHYIVNFERKFEEHVVSDFVQRIRRRTHADSVRALQRRSQVRVTRRSGAGVRRGGGGDGPLRAGRSTSTTAATG